MSTPNRPPGRASLPHTPVATPPSRIRTDSFAEPKSELLRHALEAKRAAHVTPTPTPTESRCAQPQTLKNVASDPWLDNAKDEEDTTKATPVRRPRRPSDGALPRMHTQRELQTENESLRKVQMDLKLRLQALGDQHNKLQDEADEYKERIKELEPYVAQVADLRDVNNKLSLRMQAMDNEMADLREENQEITKISEETVAEMGKREEALEEAAGLILGLETEKAAMVEEIAQLKAQAEKAQIDARQDMEAPLNANERSDDPTHVHSIDDSRPSTSYNDSDYYSMPASPHAKPSQESMVFVSDRAKKFINMKKETQRSTKDLSRRLSNASLRSQKKKTEPMPQVPQIPEAYRQQPVAPEPHRTPRRVGSLRTTLSPALAYDPYSLLPQSGSAPQTPTGSLRVQVQNGLSLDTSRHARPHSQRSSTASSPLASKSKQSRGPEVPVAPARHSSRTAHTSYSVEQLRTQYKPEDQTDAGTETTWEVPSSVASDDRTTELLADYRSPWYNQISAWGTNNRADAPGAGARSGQRGGSYTEANFLFNPAEDEDAFVEKARSLGWRR
ncbi:uncharacterized protein CC84DRAFT_1254546 [Paraphaeosphaeria sporulosa]|uniref:Uncharacterized protein n=1 Tax=Paraphaeosphaeria sporulosa TaxID=1460663 RepID=A0A177CYG3_9PLEO|nr:uncharacterized protein CC84DRAFT_1254546 [Paraphaeosphaeria sporulosa]OAG12231.1 hypothetical protein CC84DRAFT_1254546 [Paraphaeosphaeria sporulosa]